MSFPKRITVDERLVGITNNTLSAIILGYFLEEDVRRMSAKQFLRQEQSCYQHSKNLFPDISIDELLPDKWFCRSIATIRRDCCLTVSLSNISRLVRDLEQKDFLLSKERKKGEGLTKQYRVNYEVLSKRLEEKFSQDVQSDEKCISLQEN